MGNIIQIINDNHSTLDYTAYYIITSMDDETIDKIVSSDKYCKSLIKTISKLLRENKIPIDKIYNRIIHDDSERRSNANDVTKYNEVAKFYVKISHIYSFLHLIIKSNVFFEFDNLIKDYFHIFDDLYYDYDYDFDKNKFMGLSLDMQNKYNENIKLMNFRDGITTFSSITLADFNDDTDNTSSHISKDMKGISIKQYALKIKKIIGIKLKHLKKLKQIKDGVLFIYSKDPITNEKIKQINNHLTLRDIENLIINIKNIINQLIIIEKEEMNDIIKLKQAIIEKQLLDTTISQISYLEKYN
jgi:hypothetical protein